MTGSSAFTASINAFDNPSERLSLSAGASLHQRPHLAVDHTGLFAWWHLAHVNLLRDRAIMSHRKHRLPEMPSWSMEGVRIHADGWERETRYSKPPYPSLLFNSEQCEFGNTLGRETSDPGRPIQAQRGS
jgi:hypothetical protein